MWIGAEAPSGMRVKLRGPKSLKARRSKAQGEGREAAEILRFAMKKTKAL